MRFLWKTQLKKEKGRFLPAGKDREKKNPSRTKRLVPFGAGRFLLLSVLWVVFLGTVLYVVFFSTYLSISTVEIRGTGLVSEEVLRSSIEAELEKKYFGLLSRKRFFFTGSQSIESLLLHEYPLLRKVSLREVFPDALDVSVEERETIILWCSAGECVHVLENGTVSPRNEAYEQEENQQRTLTVEDLSEQPIPASPGLFTPDFVSYVLSLEESFQRVLSLSVSREMRSSSRFAREIRVRTTEGYEVYLSADIPLEQALNALGLLLETEIPKDRLRDLDYVDLRTDKRIFYQYREGTAGSEEAVKGETSADDGAETPKKAPSVDKKEQKKK